MENAKCAVCGTCLDVRDGLCLDCAWDTVPADGRVPSDASGGVVLDMGDAAFPIRQTGLAGSTKTVIWAVVLFGLSSGAALGVLGLKRARPVPEQPRPAQVLAAGQPRRVLANVEEAPARRVESVALSLGHEFDDFMAEVRKLIGRLDQAPEPIVKPSELTSSPADPDPKIAACRALVANRAEALLFFAHPSGSLIWFDEDSREVDRDTERISLTYHFMFRSLVDLKTKMTALKIDFGPDGGVETVTSTMTTETLGHKPFSTPANHFLPALLREKLAEHLDRKSDASGFPPSRAEYRGRFREWLREGPFRAREGIVLLLGAGDDELFTILHFGVSSLRKYDDATPRPVPRSVALNFRSPFTAAQSFVDAVRARNHEQVAECISKSAERESLLSNMEMLYRARLVELPDSKLDQLNDWFQNLKIVSNNQAKQTGTFGVILELETRANRYNCTLFMSKEGDDAGPDSAPAPGKRREKKSIWKVKDISAPRAFHPIKPDPGYPFWRYATHRAAVTGPEFDQRDKNRGIVPDGVAGAANATGLQNTAPSPSLGVVHLVGAEKKLDLDFFGAVDAKVGEVLELRRPSVGKLAIGSIKILSIDGQHGVASPVTAKPAVGDTIHRPSTNGAGNVRENRPRVDWGAMKNARVAVKFRQDSDAQVDARLASVRDFERRPEGEAGNHGGLVKSTPEEDDLHRMLSEKKIDRATFRKRMQELVSKKKFTDEIESLSIDYLVPGAPLRAAPVRDRLQLKSVEIVDIRRGNDRFILDDLNATVARTVDLEDRFVRDGVHAMNNLKNLLRRRDEAMKLERDLGTEARAKETARVGLLESRVRRRVEEALRAAPVEFENQTNQPLVVFVTAIRDEEGEELELFGKANAFHKISRYLEAYRCLKNAINLIQIFNHEKPMPWLPVGPTEKSVPMRHRGRPVVTSMVRYYTETIHGTGPEIVVNHEHFDVPFRVVIGDEAVHCPTEVLAAVVGFDRDASFEHYSNCEPYQKLGIVGPYLVDVCEPRCLIHPRRERSRGRTTTTILVRNPTRRSKRATLTVEFDSDLWILDKFASRAFLPAKIELDLKPESDLVVRLVARPADFKVDAIGAPPVITDITDCEKGP